MVLDLCDYRVGPDQIPGYMLIFVAEMHMQNRRCNDLIETTAAALNDETVTLMLLAVQKGNLELSVKLALNRSVCQLKV